MRKKHENHSENNQKFNVPQKPLSRKIIETTGNLKLVKQRARFSLETHEKSSIFTRITDRRIGETWRTRMKSRFLMKYVSSQNSRKSWPGIPTMPLFKSRNVK